MMWIWICLALLFVIELSNAKDIYDVYQRLLNDEKRLLTDEKAVKFAFRFTKIHDDLMSFEVNIDSFTDVNEETLDKLRTIVDEAKYGKKTWKDVTDFAYMHGIKLIIETKKRGDEMK